MLGAGLLTPPGPRLKVSMRFTSQSKIDGSLGLFLEIPSANNDQLLRLDMLAESFRDGG